MNIFLKSLFILLLPVILFANIENTASDNKTKLTALSTLIKDMSKTAHFLQQERGASSGYIESGGKNFQLKLKDIKKNSDREKKKLLAKLSANSLLLQNYFTLKEKNSLYTLLNEIPKLREDVKSLQINFSQSYSKYTQIIAFLLLNITDISDKIINTKLSSEVYTYSLVLMYKESIAQKRAALSGLFSHKVFSKEVYEYFLTADTQEKIYLKTFLHSVNDETKKFYFNTLDTDATRKVKEYENIAFEKLSGKDVNVNPEKWFQLITKKINLVQDVENKIFSDIQIAILKLNDTVSMTFTQEEKEWLQQHPVVKFAGDPSWLPFEAFNEKGEYIGIIAEYLKKLESVIGIKFDRIATKSWSKSVELSESKDVDIISETIESQRDDLIFTKPYIRNEIVIVMEKEHKYVEGLTVISDQRIALIKDYGYIHQIVKKYPDISFVIVDTVGDGLLAVSTGKIDALVCTFALASYTTTKMGISSIKIVGKTQFSTSLGLGVRDDYSPLVSILNKAIDSISEEEHNEIFNHWIKQDYVARVDYSLLYKVAGGSFLLIIMFLYWNRKMAKEIAKRKIVEDEMQETQERLNLTIAGSGDGLWDVDYIQNKLWWSPQFKKMVGYEDDEFEVKLEEWTKTLHPDDIEMATAAFENHLQSDTPYDVIYRMIHKNGDTVWIHSRAKTLKDSTGKPLRTSGSAANITELKKVENEIKESQEQFTSMVSNIPGVIYRCLLDEYWTMLFMSDEIKNLTGYPAKDFLNNSVRTLADMIHPDDIEDVLKYVVEQVSNRLPFKLEYRIIDKDGITRWVRGEGQAFFSKENEMGWLDGVIFDITPQKELEEKIKQEKEFTQTLLDSQEQLIITTDGITLITANKTFFDFFTVVSVANFIETYDAKCICDIFNENAPDGYLQRQIDGKKWIDYIIANSSGKIHKVMITLDEIDFVFSVTAAKISGEEGYKSAVFTNITEMEKAKQEVDNLNKHTRDSIEYASLIQHSLIPDKNIFTKYFKDSFLVWQPKDIVGGDIYLMEGISEDEVLLMVIDCTGHGVPGAFVTMLVKAIEREILSNVHISDNKSPAKILATFNRSIKSLLKQEDSDAISNAGFDGAIIYYNKKEKIMKYAGSNTPLYYYQDEKMTSIKGDRHSVGYKKSDVNYEFTEHTIDVSKETQVFISTDGYFDQCGGQKGFPFGKKHFAKLIEENIDKSMQTQEKRLMSALEEYAEDSERNDDVTVVGFKI